jgi:hypothetical protein
MTTLAEVAPTLAANQKAASVNTKDQGRVSKIRMTTSLNEKKMRQHKSLPSRIPRVVFMQIKNQASIE